MFTRLRLRVYSSAAGQDGISLDETAHFLAGMPVQGRLASLTLTAGWQAHAAALDKAWKTKEFFQLGPIASWMSAHAGEYYHSSNTMYYMFGGPDFLYAYTFFPNANTYILAGLEPVGHVPDVSRMDPVALVNNLTSLRNSMSTLLITHYFVTEEMKASLGRSELGGTVPILYVFLARLGCNILETAHVSAPAEGVRITFTHDEGFSGVRNFLLERSKVIVQDDSGIPLRAFNKNWSLEFHGRFIPHGEKFGKYNQQELAAIYKRDPPPPALGFAFGYWWQSERGLLILARRK